jgi:hypothetical protein
MLGDVSQDEGGVMSRSAQWSRGPRAPRAGPSNFSWLLLYKIWLVYFSYWYVLGGSFSLSPFLSVLPFRLRKGGSGPRLMMGHDGKGHVSGVAAVSEDRMKTGNSVPIV